MKYALCLMALAFAALPLVAQEYPALYDVTDVAADDVLNVRSGPGTDHEIIAAFSHNSTDIEVVGLSSSGRWGRVNAGGAAGWTSMRFLGRVPGQDQSLFPARLWCAGTEPFWSMRLNNGVFTYAAPDTAPVDDLVEWTGASSNIGAQAYGFSTLGTTGVVSRQMCSDGMSDRAYGFALNALRQSSGNVALLSGCCTLQAP